MDRKVTRGDTPRKAYKLFNLAGDPLPLEGHTIWLTVKEAPDNDVTDATAILKHYIEFDATGAIVDSHGFELGGIDPDPASPTYEQPVTGVLSGVVTHIIPQADSTAMTVGVHVYDVQVMGPLLQDGSRYFETPVKRARFEVEADVTRRITVP